MLFTNVVTFSLVFWELDSGGPVKRALAESRKHPDFQFPQDENPQLATRDWAPALVDYLYVSVTNSIAFSPTDAMPLTRSAKLFMGLEAGVSAVTVLIVAARAINILGQLASLPAPDEPEARPRRVDRRDLRVDEPERKRDLADDVLGHVGRHLRRTLRPRDPEHAVGEDRRPELLDPRLEIEPLRREADDDVGPGGVGDASRAGRQRCDEIVGVTGVGDDRERATLGDPELPRERGARVPLAQSCTDPSSPSVHQGLCATSHGWPSGSTKTPE